ncbi:MAG TPA: iron-sulfur cluster repair di-iron protein [Acidimicrobiales bacterium]|nr:iron-sulfur cluster repair di-iron protein [Acidimicrobiales bacterium]
MTIVHDTDTLGDLVAANPAAARVLDGFGLDYCCHGDRSLVDACAAAGLDARTVADELAGLDVAGDTEWTTLAPDELAAHIVATHHRYLWDELPLLESLAAKVLDVHGERHPELGEVHELVVALRADLEPHLTKEERVLFPAIEALTRGQREFPFGPVANPIRVMIMEHDRAGELLARVRAATGGYSVPADGCASYRSLYERLAALELDTHQHIHKENHVLFPAALRLADA